MMWAYELKKNPACLNIKIKQLPFFLSQGIPPFIELEKLKEHVIESARLSSVEDIHELHVSDTHSPQTT